MVILSRILWADVFVTNILVRGKLSGANILFDVKFLFLVIEYDWEFQDWFFVIGYVCTTFFRNFGGLNNFIIFRTNIIISSARNELFLTLISPNLQLLCRLTLKEFFKASRALCWNKLYLLWLFQQLILQRFFLLILILWGRLLVLLSFQTTWKYSWTVLKII